MPLLENRQGIGRETRRPSQVDGGLNACTHRSARAVRSVGMFPGGPGSIPATRSQAWAESSANHGHDPYFDNLRQVIPRLNNRP